MTGNTTITSYATVLTTSIVPTTVTFSVTLTVSFFLIKIIFFNLKTFKITFFLSVYKAWIYFWSARLLIDLQYSTRHVHLQYTTRYVHSKEESQNIQVSTYIVSMVIFLININFGRKVKER